MFRKIKIELYLIRKLFSQKYNLVCYCNYFKNKIFGGFFLSRLPRHECSSSGNFAVHVLCQKGDLQMLEWSLRSFLYHSGLCPQIIVHDDGSIDRESAESLESRFSNLKVLFKAEADRLIYENKEITEKVKEYRRRGHIMMMEFMDILLLSKAPKIMVMDSDILFFNRPDEIIDFINGKSPYDALISRQYGTYDLMIKEKYSRKYKIVEREAGFMNPGLIVFNKECMRVDGLLEYFDNTTREYEDYFVGMAGWASLISQTNFGFFSEEKYIIKGRPTANTVMKHFTGPRRQELYAYGIDMLRKRVKSIQS